MPICYLAGQYLFFSVELVLFTAKDSSTQSHTEVCASIARVSPCHGDLAIVHCLTNKLPCIRHQYLKVASKQCLDGFVMLWNRTCP
jgi:hypothetical protein